MVHRRVDLPDTSQRVRHEQSILPIITIGQRPFHGSVEHLYPHHRSENLDAMRADAQRLSRTVHTIDSAEGPILPEKNEPVPLGPTFRLSADPTAMAAACAIHTGQAAQEMGRLNVAQEMFHMVIINFPQSRYQYYAAQARRGLEQLDAASRASLSGLTM